MNVCSVWSMCVRRYVLIPMQSALELFPHCPVLINYVIGSLLG